MSLREILGDVSEDMKLSGDKTYVDVGNTDHFTQGFLGRISFANNGKQCLFDLFERTALLYEISEDGFTKTFIFRHSDKEGWYQIDRPLGVPPYTFWRDKMLDTGITGETTIEQLIAKAKEKANEA